MCCGIHPVRTATFGELAARAEQLPVPDGVEPKAKSAYKLIGREGRLRIDAPDKILGATPYTIDVALPGLLTAVVLHPPRFGATARDIDDRAARATAGVVAVVPIDEGVAVVGETFDDAHRGLKALDVTWDDTNAERRSSDELLAEHRRLIESGEKAVVVRDDGDVDDRLAAAAHTSRRPVRAPVPGARPDGAQQRGLPHARRRRPRGVGIDRVSRVHPYGRLRCRGCRARTASTCT